MTYCATSHNKGSNLPFHAMSEARDSFRAIAAALTAAGTAADYIPGATVAINVDGFQVTTQTPLEAAAKYNAAVRKAVRKNSGRKKSQPKWSDKDEAYYVARNGQPTEPEAQYSIFEPTTTTTEDQPMINHSELPSNKALHQSMKAAAAAADTLAAMMAPTPAADEAREAMQSQAAATLEESRGVVNADLLKALQAELATPAPAKKAATPAPILEATPAPAKKAAKTPAKKAATLEAVAAAYDYTPSTTTNTIAAIAAQYDQTPAANPLEAVAALYDITSESSERVTLAALTDIYQAPTQTAAIVRSEAPAAAQSAPAPTAPRAPIDFAPIKTAVKRAAYSLAAVFTVFVIAA